MEAFFYWLAVDFLARVLVSYRIVSYRSCCLLQVFSHLRPGLDLSVRDLPLHARYRLAEVRRSLRILCALFHVCCLFSMSFVYLHCISESGLLSENPNRDYIKR